MRQVMKWAALISVLVCTSVMGASGAKSSLVTRISDKPYPFTKDHCLKAENLRHIYRFSGLHNMSDGSDKHYTAYLAVNEMLIHLHVMPAKDETNVFSKDFDPVAYMKKAPLQAPKAQLQGDELFCTYAKQNGIVVQTQMYVGQAR